MIVTAKSLFRAMKTQRKPEEPRREGDFYPTGQPEAIRGLLAVDGERLRALGRVTQPKIITISQGSGVLAQGEQVGDIIAGRATINVNGQLLTGWYVPPIRRAEDK